MMENTKTDKVIDEPCLTLTMARYLLQGDFKQVIQRNVSETRSGMALIDPGSRAVLDAIDLYDGGIKDKGVDLHSVSL